jgi:DNA primase
VPGRIQEADVAMVRERSPIADVVGQQLSLRPAGGGNLKGLCPFHEEKTPSFQVTPARGLYHCFGCGAGGDVFTFVEKLEQLTFTEAVESLARRAGVELRYERAGAAPGRQAGQRRRLLDAHAAAAAFYADQLAGAPEAEIGRCFLAERGFDAEAWTRFGVGYAPGGRPSEQGSLVAHLRRAGFAVGELETAGLARNGRSGPVDRFRGRLVWPIRDIKGDVVAFGARRLHDDDPIQAKYLNSPETPIYKKSGVLYGLDLAKTHIAGRMQAVVVEGYTDVMACHLAGVPTAVATCGTTFGAEHVMLLRRLLIDTGEFRGRVIFTFDGDEAGRRAALRAFADDQRFVTQTFVAVESSGKDPCELRLASGDAAVRDLVAGHRPLVEFALRSTLAHYDLDLAEGRVQALEATAPMVASIKDHALRPEYARRLAGWLGMSVEGVLAAVSARASAAPRETGRTPRRIGGGDARNPGASSVPSMRASAPRPDPRDPRRAVEREALKLALQDPALVAADFDEMPDDAFTAPGYAAVHAAITAAGGAGRAGAAWVGDVADSAGDDRVRSLVTELAVEAIPSDAAGKGRYARTILAKVAEAGVRRRLEEAKSRLQRINPVESGDEHRRRFGELMALEQRARALREAWIGDL